MAAPAAEPPAVAPPIDVSDAAPAEAAPSASAAPLLLLVCHSVLRLLLLLQGPLGIV